VLDVVNCYASDVKVLCCCWWCVQFM